jgi:membrane protease YdiL (CAAX protease family)
MSRITSAARVIRDSYRRSIYLRVAVLFALSCVFSWWGYAIALATGSDVWAENFPLGPLVAAVVVISATEGRAGMRDWWRRISHIRGPVRFYAAATVFPAAIALASAGLALVAGADMPSSSLWVENVLPAMAMIIPMAILFGPMGEELSFRGWGQYRLQSTMSPLAAALLIGVGVIVWHLPIFVTGSIPWTVVLALPAVSVVYAWLYRMSGTVWTAVALHTFHNVVSGEYIGTVFDGNAAELRMGIVAAIYVSWAAYIVYRYGTSLTGRKETGPAEVATERARLVAANANS